MPEQFLRSIYHFPKQRMLSFLLDLHHIGENIYQLTPIMFLVGVLLQELLQLDLVLDLLYNQIMVGIKMLKELFSVQLGNIIKYLPMDLIMVEKLG
jgi:hypothetical protein